MMFELEERRAEVHRHRENRARQAEVASVFESVGQGNIEFEDVVDFGLTFVDEPCVTYGSHFDLEQLAEELDLVEDTSPPFPLVSGYVTEWDQDDRGFYIGAWVAVRVDFTDEIPPEAEPVLRHHFRFSAIAIKDVPVDVAD